MSDALAPSAPLPARCTVVVVGGGAAGLGAAACLQHRAIDTVVLERHEAVGASWRRRYRAVRLNTLRSMSGLPFFAIPRAFGNWPTRDDFVAYLEAYAERMRLDVRTQACVERVERTPEGYLVETARGAIEARFVVIATGFNHTPHLPDWPGAEGFDGELLHASAYQDPARFRGRSVLLVGLGNTATELAVGLQGVARDVAISMRTPPNIIRRSNFGLPATVVGRLGELGPPAIADRGGELLQRLLWGDLEPFGLARAPYGIATEIERKGLGPLVDDGFVALLKRQQVRLHAEIDAFDGPRVRLRDGGVVTPDVVIACTGYRFGLESMVGHLGVLLPSGRPAPMPGTTHPAAPGLYFNGYHAPLRGQLPSMKGSSLRLARAIAREQRRIWSPRLSAPASV